MRKLGLSLLLTSMVLVPYAALSQESQAPTADDYVCTFSGDCGANETQAETDATGARPPLNATRNLGPLDPWANGSGGGNRQPPLS